MSKKYIIIIFSICAVVLVSCMFFIQGANTGNTSKNFDKLEFDYSLSLDYAKEFSVDYYKGGYALITIVDSGRFLVVPEKKEIPKELDRDIVVLKQPLDNIYLVATSAMDLLSAVDGVGNIRLSGTNEDGWYVEEAVEALKSGKMVYAGKYNTPDYEVILENNCDLAIESTMIYHSPEVKEQLEQFGIPVLIEHSSYEEHPLGRLEWIKLYGVLLGKVEMAEEYFKEETEKLEKITGEKNTGKTVAFFYITSNGSVNVRKSDDYVAKMIELSGGKYIFDNWKSDNSLSTINMQMESFYAEAKDADYIIYNSTIDGELNSIDELLDKSDLLKDFKAVKNKNVWCTEKSMFQETTSVTDFIVDMHKILTEDNLEDKDLSYLHKLN